MKVTLLTPRLQFVDLTGRKIHALDRVHLAKYGYEHGTMCGRSIISGEDVLSDVRSVETGQVCGRCLASLRTYTGRMGTTPKVAFEREQEVRR